MFQAIETKYGTTASGAGRIRAKAWGGSLSVPYDHALDTDENHRAAAMALADKLGWSGDWRGGGAASGAGYVFVNIEGDKA